MRKPHLSASAALVAATVAMAVVPASGLAATHGSGVPTAQSQTQGSSTTASPTNPLLSNVPDPLPFSIQESGPCVSGGTGSACLWDSSNPFPTHVMPSGGGNVYAFIDAGGSPSAQLLGLDGGFSCTGNYVTVTQNETEICPNVDGDALINILQESGPAYTFALVFGG